jgi:hypothetical protein
MAKKKAIKVDAYIAHASVKATASAAVAVLKHLGLICRVADARGLCVVTAYDGLRPIH